VSIVAAAIERSLGAGGLIYLSSSARYPYTPDPRDNGFRPNCEQLAGLFPACEVLEAALVPSSATFLDSLRTNKPFALRVAARALMPFYKPRSWLFLLRYLPQIAKPYETACVLLRKT
jgi:hypothetical protein